MIPSKTEIYTFSTLMPVKNNYKIKFPGTAPIENIYSYVK
tara:strand:+ start:479 stop:598 length:120 start_codon:yes stop_codon:yes gene_type:complete